MVGGLFFDLEGVIEKYAGCFLVYLFLVLKNALLPHFYVFLWLRRVCVNWGSWVAGKHTTLEQFKKFKNN